MEPRLAWGEKTYLMGIVNVTPDSFSGDGLAPSDRAPNEVVAAALIHATSMVDAGAEILDVGAESTRPRQAYGDHPPVDAETEAALAVPVVRALAQELGDRARISIDTSKGAVAHAAVEAGATIVNDVWAARRDPGTADAAAASGSHLVLMHNQDGAGYTDGVFAAVVTWLTEAIEAALGRGVPRDRLIVDPGIGFGKTFEHNLEILAMCERFSAVAPVMIGASRKAFIGNLTGQPNGAARMAGSLAAVAAARRGGAALVRVHDVRETVDFLRVLSAIDEKGRA
jgi:dihydropteroate synthase